MARFDLAKFWSGQNEPVRAFSQWVEGHKLIGSAQPFSRAVHRAFVDANIASLGAARFANGPRASNADPAPIFIVGAPRSGTTLVEQFWPRMARSMAQASARRSAKRSSRSAAKAKTSRPLSASPRCRWKGSTPPRMPTSANCMRSPPTRAAIVDKMPGNFNCLGLVGLMLPAAKIIHCVRDPRDVGLSIFTFRFHGLHGYAHDLSDLGWYIGEHDRLMAHWRSACRTRS